MRSWSLVVVEGYDDRDFWSAWLRARGCVAAPNLQPPNPKRSFKLDVPGRSAVQLTWADSRSTVGPALRTALRSVNARYGVVVGCVDDDGEAGADPRGEAIFATIAHEHGGVGDGPLWALPPANDRATTQLGCVIWRSADSDAPGVPRQQTLERLICGALAAAHPERAQAVQQYLDGPPETIGLPHKALFGAFLAKWYTEQGPSQVYEHLFRDPLVAPVLHERLHAYEPILQAVLGPPT